MSSRVAWTLPSRSGSVARITSPPASRAPFPAGLGPVRLVTCFSLGQPAKCPVGAGRPASRPPVFTAVSRTGVVGAGAMRVFICSVEVICVQNHRTYLCEHVHE